MEELAEIKELVAFTFNVDGRSRDTLRFGRLSSKYCFRVKVELWNRFIR